MPLQSSTLACVFETKSGEFEGRLTIIRNPRTGEVWFVANEVGKAVGHEHDTNSRRAVRDLVDDDCKITWSDLKSHILNDQNAYLMGGSQVILPNLDPQTIILSEPGFWQLAMGSRTAKSKLCRRWVTHDVLPEIRKTGMYVLNPEAPETQRLAKRHCGDELGQVLVQIESFAVRQQRLLDSVDSLGEQNRELQLQVQGLQSLATGNQAAMANQTTILTNQTTILEQMLEFCACQPLEALQQVQNFIRGQLSGGFTGQTVNLCSYLSQVVTVAVRNGLALKRQAKRQSLSPVSLPPDQRADEREAGPLSLSLSSVALTLDPGLCFLAFRKIRSSFGFLAKAERLRRHQLGPDHPRYVAKPLLWAFTGPTVEGGGARYVYTLDQCDLLKEVFTWQYETTAAQRRLGAPQPTESLLQRAQRFAAGLTEAERAVKWPVHASELEPTWAECQDD